MSKLFCWKTLCEKISWVIIYMHFDKLNALAVKYISDVKVKRDV